MDSLKPTDEPRWLVVRDQTSRSVEWKHLAPGTHLRGALVKKGAEMAAVGWILGDIPYSCAFMFMDRGNQRWCIAIECYEPGTATIGHGSYLNGSAPAKRR